MRSFIAIELPETAQSALAGLQQELRKTGADIRWVKPENIHLTLKFLGDIEENSVDNIVQVIKGACDKFSPVHLEIRGTGLFPNAKSPRVIWAGIHPVSAVSGLQHAIESGLTPLGFRQEERKFTPHLTVGRVRSFQGKRPLMERIEELEERGFGEMDAKSVLLMKSELGPSGARYTKLAEIFIKKRSIQHSGDSSQ